MGRNVRITVKAKYPNYLFEKWIMELYGQSKRDNSKSQYSFKSALISLRRCPIVLKSGADCMFLKGFGNKLCKKLDQKLSKLKHRRLGDKQKIYKQNPSPLCWKSKNHPLYKAVTPAYTHSCVSTHKHTSKKPQENTNNLELFSAVNHNCVKEVSNYESKKDIFNIVLYVDNQEVSRKLKNQQSPLLLEMAKLGISFKVTHLKVADYMWVYQDIKDVRVEFLIPFLVERKRIDDFAQSLKDGRYYEQKFRLKRSGIQNILYLVEMYKNGYVGLPIKSLYQAATNTGIEDNFVVKFTKDINDTAIFLYRMTQFFSNAIKQQTYKQNIYQNIDLIPCTSLNEFNCNNSKNQRPRVTDLFIRMLVQLKGISVKKALSITQAHATPFVLYKSYKNLPENRRMNLLGGLKCEYSKKDIGCILSETVFRLFSYKVY